MNIFKLANLIQPALAPVLLTLTTAVLLNPAAGSTPAPAGPRHEFKRTPEVGVVLRREISTRHLLVAELMKTTSNGEESISQRPFDIDSTQNLTVTDEVLAISDGRPTGLRRRYLLTNFEAKSQRTKRGNQKADYKYSGKGSIAKKGVLFTWQPDEGEYGRYYDQDEGIEEVLPGLTADLSMASILPPGPVEAGDSWSLPPAVMADVLACGGDMDFGLVGKTGYSMLRTMRLGMGLNLEQVFGGKEEGTVTAFLTGTEEVNGRLLGLIHLSFDVKLERDERLRAQSGMSIQEVASGFQVESAVVTLELKGTGSLRWDMQGGYVRDAVDLHASQRVGTRIVQVRGTGDEKQTTSQELVMVGSLTHSVKCAPVE